MVKELGTVLLLIGIISMPVSASESEECADPIRIEILPAQQYKFENESYAIEQLSSLMSQQRPERCVLIKGDPAMPDAWMRQAVLTGTVRVAGIEGEISWPESSAWVELLGDCRNEPSIATCSKLPDSEFSPNTMSQYVAENMRLTMAKSCLTNEDADLPADTLDPVKRIVASGEAQEFLSEVKSLPGYADLERKTPAPDNASPTQKIELAFFRLNQYGMPPDDRRTLTQRLHAETVVTKYALLPLSPDCSKKFPLTWSAEI
ncbi:hypothetical protein [Luteimonas suaedae]|uniref:hypothetical protein n=1 Tax=Luteimonas suaedae TaxID=2605430 RepID=UPI0011EDA1D3|nr:hypothetical protein [Luteimonas suaedae]